MKIELILAKSVCFTTPVNIQEMTICPLHRERLGIGWRRSIIQRSVPPRGGGVFPYKGLMGTCGQPGYVFQDFCLNQGIGLSIFVLNRMYFLGR